MSEHPFLVVSERHVAELYLVFKGLYRFGVILFLNIVFRIQNLVYALHGGESFGYIISCLGKLFQRVDDAVEHDEIIDERWA